MDLPFSPDASLPGFSCNSPPLPRSRVWENFPLGRERDLPEGEEWQGRGGRPSPWLVIKEASLSVSLSSALETACFHLALIDLFLGENPGGRSVVAPGLLHSRRETPFPAVQTCSLHLGGPSPRELWMGLPCFLLRKGLPPPGAKETPGGCSHLERDTQTGLSPGVGNSFRQGVQGRNWDRWRGPGQAHTEIKKILHLPSKPKQPGRAGQGQPKDGMWPRDDGKTLPIWLSPSVTFQRVLQSGGSWKIKWEEGGWE